MEEESADTLPAGTLFADDYVIERQLARGGFGTVYLTTQRSTGKPRALKVLQSGLAVSGKMLERFATEARLASRIESEHVVEVVGSGVERKLGLPWLAMELLEGGDMMSLVEREGPLAPSLVRRLFLQLGHALGAAHRVGIMHLDLKPENLFIAQSKRYGEGPLLKVLDFGIARVLQPDRTGATATSVIGSPRWWAPEQSSEGTHLRPSTDVWAVGLIGFFALTGRYYWKAAQPGAPGGIGMLLVEALTEALVPPSERAGVYGCAERVPPGFDEWFARCVARDPAARFSEGGSACEALGRVLENVTGPYPAAATSSVDPLGRTSPLGTGSISSSSPETPRPADLASQTVTANGVGFSSPNITPSTATEPPRASGPGATMPLVDTSGATLGRVSGPSHSGPVETKSRPAEPVEDPVPAGLEQRSDTGLRVGIVAALLAGALGVGFVVRSMRASNTAQTAPSTNPSALGAPTATELSPLGSNAAPTASMLTALPIPSESPTAPPARASGHTPPRTVPLPRASATGAPSASATPSATAVPTAAPTSTPTSTPTATPTATTAPVPTAQPSLPPVPTSPPPTATPTATPTAEPTPSVEPTPTVAPTAQPEPTAAPSAPSEAPGAALPAFLDNPEASPASEQVRAIVAACRTETQHSELVTVVLRVNGATGRIRRTQVSTTAPELGTCIQNRVNRAAINYGPFSSQSQQVILPIP